MTQRFERRPDGERGDRGDRFEKGGKGKFDSPRDPRAKGADTGFVYVSLGRNANIRPGDLVGAIANETGLVGREIGPIRITERFSVVGVPAKSVNTVISALKGTTIKGKKPTVRPYTD